MATSAFDATLIRRAKPFQPTTTTLRPLGSRWQCRMKPMVSMVQWNIHAAACLLCLGSSSSVGSMGP
jgi:hypothetical protein